MQTPIPVKVFVIDDSPLNLKILSRFIQKLGWQVFTAEDGEQGLALIAEVMPDIVVLDVMMPGIDGFEVCRRLKATPATEPIPVIFLSALTDNESIVQGLELGAVDYIGKPFQQEEVLTRLKLQVHLYKANQALAEKNRQLEQQIRVTQQAESALSQTRINFNVAFNQSSDPTFVYGRHSGSVMEVNQRFCDFFGIQREELIGVPHQGFTFWVDDQQRQSFLQDLLRAQQWDRYPFQAREVEVYDQAGQQKTMLMSGELVEFNQVDCILFILRDITARKEAERQLKILSQACEQSPASIVITDVQGCITYVNPKFEEISGYKVHEVLGRNPRILKSGNKTDQDYRLMWKTLSSGQEWHGEFHNRRKDGSLYWERASISPIYNERGTITHYVAVKEDITLQKEQEEQLFFQAHYDHLTGLPNRALAKDRLEQAIESAMRHKHAVGVMFLDLDNFKTVNDTLGHDAGDNLLKEVAERLNRALRQTDTVARLGGDEFLIIINKLTENRKLTAIAQRLLGVLRQPVSLQGQEVFIYGSIGISLFPDDGLQADALLRNADMAMYAAKMAGRNMFRFFTTHMNTAAQERLLIESELRQGLRQEQFRICYQPVVALDSGLIVGAEALLRWDSERFGLLLPDRFLPIAEEMGFIVELGEWLLDHVCKWLAHWRSKHKLLAEDNFFWLSVNISPRQLRDSYFVDILETLLERYQLSSQCLELEITEDLIQNENSEMLKNLERLERCNITLMLDDFGTGYSSLNYLRQFNFSALKIDGSFIQSLEQNPDTASLIKAIIAMAHHLGLRVVAEGVETMAQWEFLRSQGCDYGQGFLFRAAIAPEEWEELWQEQPFRRSANGSTDQAEY